MTSRELTLQELQERLVGRRLAFLGAIDVPPLYLNPIERVLIDGDLIEVYVNQTTLIPFSLRRAEELLTRGKTETYMGEFKLRPRKEGEG